MLTIKETTIGEPTKIICDCGREFTFALHKDYASNKCTCGKYYEIPNDSSGGIWNCCVCPDNKPWDCKKE